MPKFIVLFLAEIREAVVLETHHRRAVSEQQQKQQRIQDHGQRPHSVGCYNVSLLHLLRAHKKKKKKKSRKFLFECSGHHVHYAPVTTAASRRRGGHIHPLLPVTHAIWTAGRNLVTARRKKVCGHASCEKPSCGLVKGILVHGYDIIQTSLLTFNELVCEKEPPAAVRWQKLQLAVFNRK